MIWRYEAVLPLSLPHDLLNIYYVTHRIFQRGFSTKGDEPAKTEFSLLALPKQFSKFEGAKRYLLETSLLASSYKILHTLQFRICHSMISRFFQIFTTVEHKFSLLFYLYRLSWIPLQAFHTYKESLSRMGVKWNFGKKVFHKVGCLNRKDQSAKLRMFLTWIYCI